MILVSRTDKDPRKETVGGKRRRTNKGTPLLVLAAPRTLGCEAGPFATPSAPTEPRRRMDTFASMLGTKVHLMDAWAENSDSPGSCKNALAHVRPTFLVDKPFEGIC
jgi:hypothetical protein